MSTTPPLVLVLDSGAGALSVGDAIAQHCPDIAMSLVMDNELFPYGELEDQVLLERISYLAGKYIAQQKPDLVVLACNTASTLALDLLRAEHGIAFVGVVPAIKPAAALSKTKVMGLLATPATIDRDYTAALIDNYAPDSTLIKVGSPVLASMIESLVRGQPISTADLEVILKPFTSSPDLDCLVLACTHFPLIKDRIAAIMGDKVTVLDSCHAIARRVVSMLDKGGSELMIAGDRPLSAGQYQISFAIPGVENSRLINELSRGRTGLNGLQKLRLIR